jgi:hypothetical protein
MNNFLSTALGSLVGSSVGILGTYLLWWFGEKKKERLSFEIFSKTATEEYNYLEQKLKTLQRHISAISDLNIKEVINPEIDKFAKDLDAVVNFVTHFNKIKKEDKWKEQFRDNLTKLNMLPLDGAYIFDQLLIEHKCKKEELASKLRLDILHKYYEKIKNIKFYLPAQHQELLNNVKNLLGEIILNGNLYYLATRKTNLNFKKEDLVFLYKKHSNILTQNLPSVFENVEKMNIEAKKFKDLVEKLLINFNVKTYQEDRLAFCHDCINLTTSMLNFNTSLKNLIHAISGLNNQNAKVIKEIESSIWGIFNKKYFFSFVIFLPIQIYTLSLLSKMQDAYFYLRELWKILQNL